jgi:hypothetical protein
MLSPSAVTTPSMVRVSMFVGVDVKCNPNGEPRTKNRCHHVMASSRQTSGKVTIDEESSRQDSALARALAPEEVRAGDYVTLLHEVAEVPSYFWCRDSALLAPEEIVRIRFIPQSCGTPLKVRSICLPFVLVKHPTGEQRPLDLRKHRVARLTKRYALRAWKAYKKVPAPSVTTIASG